MTSNDLEIYTWEVWYSGYICQQMHYLPDRTLEPHDVWVRLETGGVLKKS